MERIFFSPLEIEACMLAVIPRHLFVLVCDESLKRVPCPNWECLPFRHLYEPNDPSPQGRLFIGFPVFYHFSQFKLSAPLKWGPIMFQEHYSSCIPMCEVIGGGKVLEWSIYPHVFIYWLPQQRAGQYKGIPDPTAPRLPLLSRHTLASKEH